MERGAEMNPLKALVKWIRDPYKHKAVVKHNRRSLDKIHNEIISINHMTHPYRKIIPSAQVNNKVDRGQRDGSY